MSNYDYENTHQILFNVCICAQLWLYAMREQYNS